jgi:hypothetical protein
MCNITTLHLLINLSATDRSLGGPAAVDAPLNDYE